MVILLADDPRIPLVVVAGSLGVVAALSGMVWFFTGAEWAFRGFGIVLGTSGLVTGAVGLVKPQWSFFPFWLYIYWLISATGLILVSLIVPAPGRTLLV